MDPDDTKNERLSIVGLASMGVIMNLLVLSSSDLLRYQDGSLGLSKYESSGMSVAFLETEDPALIAAKKAGTFAFVLGLLYLPLIVIHNFVATIPSYSTVLIGCLCASIELCLLTVYTAKNNGICDMEGCSWGSGATWLFLSEILILGSSIGSLCMIGGGSPWESHRKVRVNHHRSHPIADY